MRSLFYPWTTHNWTFPTHRVLEEQKKKRAPGCRKKDEKPGERKKTHTRSCAFFQYLSTKVFLHPVYSSSAHGSLEIAELLVRILHIQYDDFTPRHYKNFSFRQLQKKTPLCYTALLIILLWAVEWSKLNLRSKWSSWCGMPRLSSLFNFTLHLQCFIASSPFWHVTRDCFCDI